MTLQGIFETARSGLNSTKAGIAVAGNNISNANTENYSRQRVILETKDPQLNRSGGGFIGAGNQISGIKRLNNNYIEKQINESYKKFSNHEEKSVFLKQIEDVFNEMEDGDGLSDLMSRFFNEFRKLSLEPNNLALRQSLQEAGQSVIDYFFRTNQILTQIVQNLDKKIEGYVQNINELVSNIINLNKEIFRLEQSGNGDPNDLIDKRDLAIKKLGSFFDISLHPDKSGMVEVDLNGAGLLLSSSSKNEELKFSRGAGDLYLNGHNESVSSLIQGGKLGAIFEFRNKILPEIFEKLDNLAFNLSHYVNEIHQKGVALNGQRGICFFEPLLKKDKASQNINLSHMVLSDLQFISAALDENSPGDNRVALALSNLQNKKLMGDERFTLDEWYHSILSDIATMVSKNESALHQENDMMIQFEKIRNQISGVSIDEETAYLMQLQHSFDASAKVMQFADEVLGTVLQIKR